MNAEVFKGIVYEKQTSLNFTLNNFHYNTSSHLNLNHEIMNLSKPTTEPKT